MPVAFDCGVSMPYRKLLGLAFFIGAVVPASADPVTYAGKLGGLDIVVELTDDPAAPGGPLAGRYFYRAKGVDIPLQARSSGGGRFELAEEEACGADKCGDGQPAPIGAIWKLAVKNGGKTLEGTWAAKKSLPVSLTRIGSRDYSGAENPLGLFSDSEMAFFADGEDVTREKTPYDFLRVDMAMQEDRPVGWPDASYRYVADPRTKFQRPRLVELAGGVSVEKANLVLQQRHWRDSIAALSCMALQYRGFHEDPPFPGTDGGTLGGYEDSSAEISALTPKLMSWRESGSLFCGGAHPYNYSNGINMNVATGEILRLADIFADTVDGKAGPSLLAFVKETREKPTQPADIEFEKECYSDDLITDHLGASFKRDGDRLSVVFGLQYLPHVINACGDDMLLVPLDKVAPLLKPEFKALVGL